MVESVDTTDLKSVAAKPSVRVRVSSAAPNMQACMELVYRLVSKTSARKGLRDRGPPPVPNPKADRAHGCKDGKPLPSGESQLYPVSRGLAIGKTAALFGEV